MNDEIPFEPAANTFHPGGNSYGQATQQRERLRRPAGRRRPVRLPGQGQHPHADFPRLAKAQQQRRRHDSAVVAAVSQRLAGARPRQVRPGSCSTAIATVLPTASRRCASSFAGKPASIRAGCRRCERRATACTSTSSRAIRHSATTAAPCPRASTCAVTAASCWRPAPSSPTAAATAHRGAARPGRRVQGRQLAGGAGRYRAS